MPANRYRLGLAFCVCLLFVLITFKINRPWELMHDDDGPFTVSLAMGHLKLGLQGTKGHNFQVDLKSNEIVPYPNHPAGMGLLMSGVIRVFGSDNRAAIRAVPILFQFLSLMLLVGYVKRFYGPSQALIAAYCLALIPMSSFFGRTPYHGPFLLPAMIIFILNYFKLCRRNLSKQPITLSLDGRGQGEGEPNGKHWIVAVAVGLWGAFIDWQFNFALFACFLHSLVSCGMNKDRKFIRTAVFIAVLGFCLIALNLVHQYWAFGEGGIARILNRVDYATHPKAYHPWTEIVGHALEFARRYFTEVILAGGLFYLCLRIKNFWTTKALPAAKDQVILVFFITGFLNPLLAPNYARNHHYMCFYLTPFMVLSFVEMLEWVRQQNANIFPKIRFAALVLITLSSAITLKIRHTRLHDYAIKTTQELHRFM